MFLNKGFVQYYARLIFTNFCRKTFDKLSRFIFKLRKESENNLYFAPLCLIINKRSNNRTTYSTVQYVAMNLYRGYFYVFASSIE